MSTRKYESGYSKLKKRRRVEALIESHVENDTPIDILNYIIRMNSFTNAFVAYRIMLTIHVTVASAERSFSKLKLIKSYLRSTMSQQRLNGLALLAIEKEMLTEIDYNSLINDFASQKARKLAAKFRNSGQTCVCANRILVQEGIYDKFANALLEAVQSMKVGDGFSEGVAQGPLINEAAVKKVDSLIHEATSKGAKVILGGKRHSLGSTFYEPTVITDVDNDMLISRQEAFGPVAPLLRFKTEEDAIRIANDTNAGLGSYVFTNSIQRSWRVAEALEYGLVGVNEGVISTEVAPFGGVKQSGLGREGSKYGMDEYLEIKYVCLGNMNKD